nr:hypothetical protein [Tanacetum cinerariifolium]
DEDAMDEEDAKKLKKRKVDIANKDEGPSAGSEETMFVGGVTQRPQNLRKDMITLMNHPLSMLIQRIGPDYYILKNTYKSYVELDYNMEECYKALADQLDQYNPKGDRYPFDLSKPLPLVMLGNRQIILVDYFFNNDLAYFQRVSTSRTYTSSLTKTKATKYDLPGIEDMVHNLWSLVKVAYDKHALLGTSHWGPKRQRFYGYASNRVSKHDVCSTKRILALKNVKVKEWYGYGHLEEIEVRRSDHKLYKFIEGDFPQLHLHDIKDILILLVQNRLFNLRSDVIMHLAAALHMFTRRIVIHKRVEDLYLGYDNQVFKSQVFDCDELTNSESDDNVPTSPVHDKYKSCEGYHVVPPLYTGTFMPPKLDLVFHDAPLASETVTNVVHVESSTNKTSKEMSKTLRPDAPIIED